MDTDLAYFHEESSGNLVSRFINDAIMLKGVVSNANSNDVLIPLTAFVSGSDENSYVFVVDDGGGVVHRRSVRLGEIVANGITVTKGLLAGERVAAKGVAYLGDGQSVTLMNMGPERFLQ